MFLRIERRGQLGKVGELQGSQLDARQGHQHDISQGHQHNISQGATTTSPKAAAGSSKVAVGKATSFCAAFKEMQSVKASDGAAAAGAAYQTIAAEMRKYSPAAINDAAEAYADVIENSGKALKSGTMPTAAGVSSKDLAKVTVWVTKNCKS